MKVVTHTLGKGDLPMLDADEQGIYVMVSPEGIPKLVTNFHYYLLPMRPMSAEIFRQIVSWVSGGMLECQRDSDTPTVKEKYLADELAEMHIVLSDLSGTLCVGILFQLV